VKRRGYGLVGSGLVAAVHGSLVFAGCSNQVCQEREVPEDWQSGYPGELPDERKINDCDVVQGTLEPVEHVEWETDSEFYWLDARAGARITAYLTERDGDDCRPDLKWRMNLGTRLSEQEPPREDGCPQVTYVVPDTHSQRLLIVGVTVEAHPYDLHIELEE
jgi:hypothetical protein